MFLVIFTILFVNSPLLFVFQTQGDETDNIKGKQELKKLQEEINQLQEEGVEMSEYDLENLRRKYELELAR